MSKLKKIISNKPTTGTFVSQEEYVKDAEKLPASRKTHRDKIKVNTKDIPRINIIVNEAESLQMHNFRDEYKCSHTISFRAMLMAFNGLTESERSHYFEEARKSSFKKNFNPQ